MEKSYEPLHSRSSDEEAELLMPGFPLSTRKSSSTARRVSTVFTVVTSLVAYTVLVLVLHSTLVIDECRGGPRFIPNIAQDALNYQDYYFEDHHEPDHPLFGPPSDQLNDNWGELMKCIYLLFSILASYRNLLTHPRVKRPGARMGDAQTWKRV